MFENIYHNKPVCFSSSGWKVNFYIFCSYFEISLLMQGPSYNWNFQVICFSQILTFLNLRLSKVYPKISTCFVIILKVQSCKLYDNKYMIASTQIIHAEILAFISVLVFKLLSGKVLFTNRKDNRNC